MRRYESESKPGTPGEDPVQRQFLVTKAWVTSSQTPWRLPRNRRRPVAKEIEVYRGFRSFSHTFLDVSLPIWDFGQPCRAKIQTPPNGFTLPQNCFATAPAPGAGSGRSFLNGGTGSGPHWRWKMGMFTNNLRISLLKLRDVYGNLSWHKHNKHINGSVDFLTTGRWFSCSRQGKNHFHVTHSTTEFGTP